ncbi:hypothetical protein CABS01_08995 [Colletotrichum abscissum]|uniref:uncharacterized protein n=1 Tax=Colletotrichum abscissum TaxID=1671311 RepID=UPI0027D58668|nr:uncharacterized protein CABS01_08995 [Colletotrichum abscissum]KAK1503606.1 hypothetical protein CABS01_08995 [Colletotrichum abscissum]
MIRCLCALQASTLPQRPSYNICMTQHGDVINRRPASNLERLSSFVKEAQRSCFPDLTTFHHNPSASVTLSNGFFITKSARNEVASGAINADVELSDIPSEFDDLRFYKERQESNEARSKFQVSSEKELNFPGVTIALPTLEGSLPISWTRRSRRKS